MSDQNKPTGGVSGLAGQVFAFIDKPWKVAAVVVLFVVGGMGWIVYQKLDVFVEEWMTPSSMSLKVSDVPDAMEKLIKESGADLVQVWAVDLNVNSQRFVAARRKDGERPVIPEPRRLPAISKVTDLETLANVIAGHPSCKDITTASPSPVAHRLAERGMVRACGVPIPPSPEAFVGIIYMTWLAQQDASTEEVAVSAAREIAGKLVGR